MVAEVVVVWMKGNAMEVVWVDVVLAGTLALLTEQHFVEKHVMFLCRHLEEAQSAGYIQVLFLFYP